MTDGFSFIHAADLHLDSPFRGFEQVDHQDTATMENLFRQLRDCTFVALDNVVAACLKHQVDFLVLAGDIFDAADRSLRAQLRLQKALARLAKAKIKVFIAYGNHDHEQGFRAELDWPDLVHFFPSGEVGSYPVLVGGREVARVYGISYPRRDVSDNYASLFKREPDVPFALAVLHSNVGDNLQHANYAPCSLEQLSRAVFDYWALGHVHSNQVLREYPWVVYPGTTQGRHPGETGAKGCYLVRVNAGGEVQLKFLATDSVRWGKVLATIEGLTTEQELLEQLEKQLMELQQHSGGRSLVVRLELHGRGPLHRRLGQGEALGGLLEELRYRFAGPTGPFIWPDAIRRRTAIAVDKDSLRDSATLLGDLLALGREARDQGQLRQRLEQVLLPLQQRAGRHLDLPQEKEWQELLEEAENLALDLLWDEEMYESGE